MSETPIVQGVIIYASKLGSRLFRNNTGLGWAGQVIKIRKTTTVILKEGDVVIKKAHPLHAGLCKGSSDVIGLTPVIVTLEMVGRTVGIFTAIECKTKRGSTTEEQDNFIAMVKANGGIASVCKDPIELNDIIKPIVNPVKQFFGAGEFTPIKKCVHGNPVGLCENHPCPDQEYRCGGI